MENQATNFKCVQCHGHFTSKNEWWWVSNGFDSRGTVNNKPDYLKSFHLKSIGFIQ